MRIQGDKGCLSEDRGDRGAASVVVIGVIAALLLLMAGAMALTSAVAASHRARLAADLAAIAAAMRLQDGTDPGFVCGVAQTIARDNQGRLAECRIDGDNVTVAVHVDPPRWPAPAVARAKAGPDRSGR